MGVAGEGSSEALQAEMAAEVEAGSSSKSAEFVPAEVEQQQQEEDAQPAAAEEAAEATGEEVVAEVRPADWCQLGVV